MFSPFPGGTGPNCDTHFANSLSSKVRTPIRRLMFGEKNEMTWGWVWSKKIDFFNSFRGDSGRLVEALGLLRGYSRGFPSSKSGSNRGLKFSTFPTPPPIHPKRKKVLSDREG